MAILCAITVWVIRDIEMMTVDTALFRAIGLHQLLRLEKTPRMAFAACQWYTLSTIVIQMVGMYHRTDDPVQFTMLASVCVCTMLTVFKGRTIIVCRDAMQSVIDANRRDGSSTSLRVYVTIGLVLLVVWLTSPFLMDNAADKYRPTIINLWIPIPMSVYNSTFVWDLIYVAEALLACDIMYIWLLFDCYMFTICFTLDVQFRALFAGYKRLGRSRFSRLAWPARAASSNYAQRSHNPIPPLPLTRRSVRSTQSALGLPAGHVRPAEESLYTVRI